MTFHYKYNPAFRTDNETAFYKSSKLLNEKG